MTQKYKTSLYVPSYQMLTFYPINYCVRRQGLCGTLADHIASSSRMGLVSLIKGLEVGFPLMPFEDATRR